MKQRNILVPGIRHLLSLKNRKRIWSVKPIHGRLATLASGPYIFLNRSLAWKRSWKRKERIHINKCKKSHAKTWVYHIPHEQTTLPTAFLSLSSDASSRWLSGLPTRRFGFRSLCWETSISKHGNIIILTENWDRNNNQPPCYCIRGSSIHVADRALGRASGTWSPGKWAFQRVQRV